MASYNIVLGHTVYVMDEDTGELTDKNGNPVDIQKLKCTKCGKMATSEGHDACLGTLPGVKAACCGHGVDEGYILFDNGIKLVGHFEVAND